VRGGEFPCGPDVSIAWLVSDDTVSNARMQILSTDPLRMLDLETGEEFGPEHMVASTVKRGGRVALYMKTVVE
jgi:hypothetical protein